MRDQYYHWPSERYSLSDMRFWTSSSSSLSIQLFFFNRYILFIDVFCIWSSIIKVIIFCNFEIFYRFMSCENHATPSRENWRQKIHYSTGKIYAGVAAAAGLVELAFCMVFLTHKLHVLKTCLPLAKQGTLPCFSDKSRSYWTGSRHKTGFYQPPSSPKYNGLFKGH